MSRRSYCDTSALIALTTGRHPHRKTALGALDAEPDLHVALHGMAEYFATMTKVRLPYAITPAEAQSRIADLLQDVRLTVVEMTLTSYRRAIELAADVPMPSGSVYDALPLACAEQAGCERLLTLNGRNFLRMATLTEVEIVGLR